MSGSFGEMGNLLKQAQEMQRQLDQLRERFAEMTVEGTAGGGAVRVEATCDYDVKKVHLAEELLRSPEKALIEELVLGAMRDTLAKFDSQKNEVVSKLTGGMRLPGMF